MTGPAARVALVLFAAVVVFVLIANTAVVWHGAIFIALLPLWGYVVQRALEWAVTQ